MKQLLIILCSLLSITSTCLAQDEKQKINTIKMDENYFSAEASDANNEVAKAAAIANLQGIIQTVRQINCDSAKLTHAVSTIEMKRGTLSRVFVYIKTTDIANLGISSVSQVVTPTVVTQPIKTERPVIFRPRVPDALQEVMATQDALTVHDSLITMKGDGRITGFGGCSHGNVPQASYIVVYDRSHTVKAVLGPDSGNGRQNMKTHQSDAMTNYSGCGAIWFTVE